MADYDLAGTPLPYNPEAEQAVIGALLIDGELVGDVVTLLHPEHFYANVNRGVYEAIFDLYTRGEKIDIVTVINAAVMQGVFESDAAAKSYLVGVMKGVPSPKSVVKYSAIVIEKFLLRSLILASRDIIETAASSAEPAETVVDYAEQKIFDIREGAENKTLVPLRSIVYERLKAFCDLVTEYQRNGHKPVMTGLSTGYSDLDRMISGLNRSDLVVLAARPGMGKTALALNIAVNVAKKYKGKSVAIFNLEMSKEQLASRVLSSEARVSSEVMRTGRIASVGVQDERERIMKVTQYLQSLEVYIDDTPGTNVPAIKAKLRRMKNLGLVVIDYLQLMNSVGNYHGNRVAEVSEITRQLKIMAKELNVPVLVLSQLARATEQRPDKRPLMSDLRDSGSIEQDADIVLFLYRNSYYDKTDPVRNVCECIIAKNRQGETGTIKLGWLGEYTKFTEVEYVSDKQPQPSSQDH